MICKDINREQKNMVISLLCHIISVSSWKRSLSSPTLAAVAMNFLPNWGWSGRGRGQRGPTHQPLSMWLSSLSSFLQAQSTFSWIFDLMQKVATKREVGESEMRMMNKLDMLSWSVEVMRKCFKELIRLERISWWWVKVKRNWKWKYRMGQKHGEVGKDLL